MSLSINMQQGKTESILFSCSPSASFILHSEKRPPDKASLEDMQAFLLALSKTAVHAFLLNVNKLINRFCCLFSIDNQFLMMECTLQCI